MSTLTPTDNLRLTCFFSGAERAYFTLRALVDDKKLLIADLLNENAKDAMKARKTLSWEERDQVGASALMDSRSEGWNYACDKIVETLNMDSWEEDRFRKKAEKLNYAV